MTSDKGIDIKKKSKLVYIYNKCYVFFALERLDEMKDRLIDLCTGASVSMIVGAKAKRNRSLFNTRMTS